MKNKTKIKIFATMLAMIFGIAESNGQTLAWAKTHGTSLGADDLGNAIKVDGSGNVFVGGREVHTAGNGYDMMLLKYNSSGTLQWDTPVNGSASGADLINDIAIDGSGNIYAVGFLNESTNGQQMGLVKFNASGVWQWTQVSGTSVNTDVGNGVEISSDGYIYVCGSYNNDAALWKYDASGNIQWGGPALYNGTGSSTDWANDLVIDGSSYIFTCGTTFNSSGNFDCLALKYNSSGTLQSGWPQAYPGAGSLDDELFNLKLSGQYIYTCGYAYVSAGNSFDALLIKYAVAGGSPL
ncbi:MAG: hypothetical protein WED06_00090 [Candidatus Paceibacterota bacterium]